MDQAIETSLKVLGRQLGLALPCRGQGSGFWRMCAGGGPAGCLGTMVFALGSCTLGMALATSLGRCCAAWGHVAQSLPWPLGLWKEEVAAWGAESGLAWSGECFRAAWECCMGVVGAWGCSRAAWGCGLHGDGALGLHGDRAWEGVAWALAGAPGEGMGKAWAWGAGVVWGSWLVGTGWPGAQLGRAAEREVQCWGGVVWKGQVGWKLLVTWQGCWPWQVGWGTQCPLESVDWALPVQYKQKKKTKRAETWPLLPLWGLVWTWPCFWPPVAKFHCSHNFIPA